MEARETDGHRTVLIV